MALENQKKSPVVLWGGQEVVEAGGEAREEEPQGRSRASLGRWRLWHFESFLK